MRREGDKNRAAADSGALMDGAQTGTADRPTPGRVARWEEAAGGNDEGHRGNQDDDQEGQRCVTECVPIHAWQPRRGREERQRGVWRPVDCG
ncbi:hypothetical protein Afe04nite_75110 [Asanoa ferruginea]|nr:hypothetical protein Afe04nite_75110 [Asanoa ferruginea]